MNKKNNSAFTLEIFPFFLDMSISFIFLKIIYANRGVKEI